MFDIALGVFLFLSPIVILIGNNAVLNGTMMALQFYQFKTMSTGNDVFQLQFFQYGIVVLFIIALMNRPLRFFKDRYLALFLGLCALSVVFHPKTIPAFTPIFFGILFYYLIVQYAKDIKKLLYPVVFISFLNTFFAVLQFFKIYWIYHPATSDNYIMLGRYDGLMAISSHLGIYQALALPICYAINPYLTVIPLIGLLLSKSATAILAGAIGMAYLLYPKRKKIFIAPIGWIVIFTILATFALKAHKLLFYKIILRSGLWINTLREIFTHPLGFGLGSFSELSNNFYSNMGRWVWAYNEPLEIAFCVGIAVWFIMFMFLWDKFEGVGEGLRRNISASCLIALVVCLGQPALHFARLSGTIITLFAFLEVMKRKEICDAH